MGKSRAEIQKAYRERKKEHEGSRYLDKERKRVHKYYTPIAEQSNSSKKTRRDKVRQYVREHRVRKRLEQENDNQNGQKCDETQREDENGVSSSTGTGKLILKFPAFDPKNRTRKRIARATAKNHREIKRIREENEKLKKQVKKVSKRNERLKKSLNKMNNSDLETTNNMTPRNKSMNEIENFDGENIENMTPRKRVSTELSEMGVSPRKIPKRVRDTLVFAHVVADEVKNARDENGHKGRNMIARVISGKLVKKYRMKMKLNKLTGISRQSESKSKKCDTVPKIQKRMQEREKLRNAVYKFLLEDENSRVMPGKNDKVKEGSQLKQKRVLNDNMTFLHLKFKAETDEKISFATFCRMRPKSVCLTRYITRNQCLCQKHQNMALTLKAMKSAGALVPINPDEYIRKLEGISLDEYTEHLTDIVHHQQWQKVTLKDGKKRTKVVGKDIGKDEFKELVQTQTYYFKEHVFRIKKKYKAMLDLKETIIDDQAIIQMDFAENFSCSSADEVQSAYWNANTVTLHPVVVYFKENGATRHVNYVFVSDDLGHNIGTVYAILKKLMSSLKEKINGLRKVFYWTDSPSSQYRNKTSFYLVSAHDELLETEAEWNFWETGHGKGACDGVGGTAKRMADMNVRQGKVSIQDATDFFMWGSKYHTSANYIFVTEDECRKSRGELDEINKTIIPVKGTMKVHHVFSDKKGTVKTRLTSCYCDSCVAGNHHDVSEHKLLKDLKDETGNKITVDQLKNNIGTADPVTNTPQVDNGITSADHDISENSWVAVNYEDHWHVGHVIEVDKTDQDCLVSFMRHADVRGKKHPAFKWPSPPDEIWVKFSSIIMGINEPIKIGRSGRSFEIPDVEIEKIQQLFE